MASTSILNHYRNLIVSDKELFTLLTIIFKEGDVSEKSLLQRTNFTPSVLKLSLDKLFMSNLAKTEAITQYWVCTQLGKELLSALDINEVSSVSYVSEQDIPDDEKDFLISFLKKRFDQNSDWSKKVNSQLRVLTKAFKATSKDELINEVTRTRAIRAILVGSDMSASKLEFDSYYELLKPQIESMRIKLFKLNDSSKSSLKHSLYNIYRSASEDYKASNQFFTSTVQVNDPVVLFISFSRLLTNVKEDSDVCDFKYIYNLDKNFHKRALNKIKLKIPQIEESILKDVFIGSIGEEEGYSIDKLRKEMLIRLEKTFEEQHRQNIFLNKPDFVNEQNNENNLEYYEKIFDELMECKFMEFSGLEKLSLYLKTSELKSYMEQSLTQK